MSNLRDGDRLVLFPRWTVDERLPVAERKEFTPTPKQMLYGQRAELIRIVATEKDACGPGDGGVRRGRVEGVAWQRCARSRTSSRPINRPLEDGKLYTLDPCPNDWYGYWCGQVVEGLVRRPAERAVRPAGDAARRPATAPGLPGQAAFLAGLDAFRDAGLLHDFEAGKREFIGGHARTPVLLVQGPPGTGKIVLDRLRRVRPAPGGDEGEAGPYRVFLSCKTHAATDVLLKNVLEVQEKLRELRDGRPEAVRQALRRPAARRAALPGGPERPAAGGRRRIWRRTPRRRRTRTTTPT